jgi:LCP family protein required for cell wall assembly
MNCSQARQLIDKGVTPGSHPPLRAELGFHLLQCESCRAYRARAQAGHLPARRQTVGLRARALLRRPWAIMLLTLLLLLSVPLVWAAVVSGGVMLRTQRNLDAMIVTPVRVAAVSAPASPVPGGEPGLPAAMPTDAHIEPVQTPTAASEPAEQPAEAPTAPQLISGEDVATNGDAHAVATAWPTLEVLPSPAATAQPGTPVPTLPFMPVEPGDDVVNVLVLGTDRRPDEADVTRTDTIMLVRIDPDQPRVAALSLLRDMWIEIPGFGYERLNKAYMIGEHYYGPGGGLMLTRRTVGSLLDVPVNYVVLLDFQGFTNMVDMIGGITVNVEEELHDDQFPTMHYGYMTVHFDPGSQHMDGRRALIYSRIRHPDSDFSRVQRQQAVVAAIAERLRERGDLENILAADQLTGALVGYVQTDMPQARIIELALAMRDFDINQVERYTVTEDMVSEGLGSDQFALVPYQGALDRLARQFMYGRSNVTATPTSTTTRR